MYEGYPLLLLTCEPHTHTENFSTSFPIPSRLGFSLSTPSQRAASNDGQRRRAVSFIIITNLSPPFTHIPPLLPPTHFPPTSPRTDQSVGPSVAVEVAKVFPLPMVSSLFYFTFFHFDFPPPPAPHFPGLYFFWSLKYFYVRRLITPVEPAKLLASQLVFT